MVYILTVRRNIDGNSSLVVNLGVFNELSTAITFVIKQRQAKAQFFNNGILKFDSPDALGAYLPTQLGNNVLLFYNGDFKVVAEKALMY